MIEIGLGDFHPHRISFLPFPFIQSKKKINSNTSNDSNIFFISSTEPVNKISASHKFHKIEIVNQQVYITS